jgi:hypothetical protein
MTCEAPITEKAAKDLYDRLLAAHGADGCVLDELETDKDRMVAIWKLQDRSLPEAAIVRKECAEPGAVVGPSFAIRVPQPLRDACPTTVSAAVAIVERESFETVPQPQASSHLGIAVVGAVALAVIAFNVTMVLRHR